MTSAVGAYNPHPTTAEVDAELVKESDAVIARMARDFNPAELAGRKWEVLPESLRYSMRAANEQARRQDEARRAAAERAETERLQARHDASVAVRVAEFKVQAAAAFPGSSAEFEQAWPDILRAWQLRQTLESVSASEYKRGDYRNSF